MSKRINLAQGGEIHVHQPGRDPRLDTALNLFMAKVTILVILGLASSLGIWAIVWLWTSMLSMM